MPALGSFPSGILLASLLLGPDSAVSVPSGAPIASPTVGRESNRLYAELCAGCHGEKLEDGKGPNLTSGQWRHGEDDASLARSILQGYPQSEMSGFAAQLGSAETRALITFIREKAVRVGDPQPAASAALPAGTQTSKVHPYRFEIVATGLEVPWTLAFFPGGRMLVTERAGRLRMVADGVLDPVAIDGTPAVVAKDEAGLMSVLPHPDFAHHGWIYLSYSDRGEAGTAMTKIVRGRIRDIKTGADGLIYVALERVGQPGLIARLVPAPE